MDDFIVENMEVFTVDNHRGMKKKEPKWKWA